MTPVFDDTALGLAMPAAVQKAQAQRASTIAVLGEMLGQPAAEVAKAVARRLRWGYVESANDFVLRTDCLSASQGLLCRVAHVASHDVESCLLVEDPLNDETLSQARSLVDKDTLLLVADGALVDRFLGLDNRVEGRIRPDAGRNSVEAHRSQVDDRDVVSALDRVLLDAWECEASDVHLETTRTGLTVRYRLDGLLIERAALAGVPPAQTISRLKVMANLDIAERRVPQDGRFSLAAGGRRIDCRVSVMPSGLGEDAVVRILDKRRLAGQDEALGLHRLGFSSEMAYAIRQLMTRPHGMLLVTGPTGSGKTTTLYAALTEVRTGREKVVTIEDPVEYELEGVLQVPVNEKKGLTFARGLRSILRHDPDVIMVGEIRDRETAEIAVQSALTGHQVFTTVHANDALDVVSRFIHMNVDLYGLVAGLNGVLAQRLIRLVCPNCSAPDTRAGTRLAELAKGLLAYTSSFTPKTGVGCPECRGTGYKGRTVLGELLVLDDKLRDMLIDRKAISEVREYSRTRAFGSLRMAALDLVASGRTTVEEASRVVGLA